MEQTLTRIQLILEQSEEGGYTAIGPSLPGCISEGDTKQETLKNIREAIELYLEPVEDDQIMTELSHILKQAKFANRSREFEGKGGIDPYDLFCACPSRSCAPNLINMSWVINS